MENLFDSENLLDRFDGFKEVERVGSIILYETTYPYEICACTPNDVNLFFPNFKCLPGRQYFIGKGEEIYNSETMENIFPSMNYEMEFVATNGREILYRFMTDNGDTLNNILSREELLKKFPNAIIEPCDSMLFEYVIMDAPCSDVDYYDETYAETPCVMVAEKDGMQLLEKVIHRNIDPHENDVLKTFFPDYNFKVDRQYFLVKDSVLYNTSQLSEIDLKEEE